SRWSRVSDFAMHRRSYRSSRRRNSLEDASQVEENTVRKKRCGTESFFRMVPRDTPRSRRDRSDIHRIVDDHFLAEMRALVDEFLVDRSAVIAPRPLAA